VQDYKGSIVKCNSAVDLAIIKRVSSAVYPRVGPPGGDVNTILHRAVRVPILKARMELISIGACVPLLYWTVNQGVDVDLPVEWSAERKALAVLEHGV